MIVSRRYLLGLGGGLAAGLVVRPEASRSGTGMEIVMRGNADGSRVGYDPLGLHVEPGSTIRWINRDAGNAHTATAYHPGVMNRPRRVPEGVEPWDSGYLLPGDSFSVTLTQPGVYDYYCVPHEHAGMVGRIVVGELPDGWSGYDDRTEGDAALPQAALDGFPPVGEILRLGRVGEA